MMKSITVTIIVDSVEEAVKFYTEKLPFDIVELQTSSEGHQALSYAHLRKGKASVIFRTPYVEEFADFTFIKRCASRCVCLFVEVKKGVEKFYDKCKKRDLKIVTELKDCESGFKLFALKDPFGMKLVFAEPIQGFVAKKPSDFLGMSLAHTAGAEEQTDSMISHLKSFGILRRASKKYAKHFLKVNGPKKQKG